MEWASATWQLRHALLLLFLLRPTAAQIFNSSPPPPISLMIPPRPQFNPAMAAIVIALISLFLVMAFFSIYFRSRRALQELERAPAAGPTRVNAASRGLDPAVVESFPKFVYSEVKQHKIGKGALECAVCLSEFEDDDTLRLLPKCDHVFHPDCIDSWFASHTTCPVCRTNLAETAVAAPPEAVVITVVDGEVTAPSPPPPPTAAPAVVEDEEELPPLPPGRQRRKIPRSHSTGHSLAEDRERYTLRLPETIRRDVVAGALTRSTSCYAGGGESSARKGRGELGGRGRSSFKTRTWERWASFKRSFSARGSRGEDAGGSGGTGAVDRSLSKKKEVRYAEEGSVNIPV